MKKKNFYVHSLRRACLTGALVLTAAAASAQSTVVKGTVKDATGEPVIGASIKVQGDTKSGAITDIDGNYEIQYHRQNQRLRSLTWDHRPRWFP